VIIKIPKTDKEIEAQNNRIAGYVVNVFISMVTALIIVFLSK